ncbi:hypothetical protein BJX62DRAFT_243236 [Aspergillus germanicus]
MKDERGVGVTSCELQVAARFKPAGLIYTHESVMSNTLAWALAEDAIRNGGPGRYDRIDMNRVCMHTMAPCTRCRGTQALTATALKHILLYMPQPWREPELPLYATEEEKTYMPEEVHVGAGTDKVSAAVAEVEVSPVAAP